MELRNKQRVFLSVFFFHSGICFSSWTSRIPTIKTFFGFSEAELAPYFLRCLLALSLDCRYRVGCSHLLAISIVTLSTTLFSCRFLITNDKSPSGNKLILSKPDPYLYSYLGCWYPLLPFVNEVCLTGVELIFEKR